MLWRRSLQQPLCRPRRWRGARAEGATCTSARWRVGAASLLHGCGRATWWSSTTPVAGLLLAARDAGARTVFRCHLGVDEPNAHARRAWDFLRPGSRRPTRTCSRARSTSGRASTVTGSGSNSPRSTRSRPRIRSSARRSRSILDRVGLTQSGSEAEPKFTRFDGSPYRVNARAAIDQDAPIPDRAEVIAQVSGWGRLKDQAGLVEAFSGCRHPDLHLVVAGPRRSGAEESEERGVIAELRERRRSVSSPSASGSGRGPRRRSRRERSDRERYPAPRRRGRPQEPAGGIRPIRHRGDVEGATGAGRSGGWHPGTDPRRRNRGAGRPA